MHKRIRQTFSFDTEVYKAMFENEIAYLNGIDQAKREEKHPNQCRFQNRFSLEGIEFDFQK